MGAIARFFEPFHRHPKVSLIQTRGTDSAEDEEIKREAAADVERIEQDDKYFAPETPADRDELLSPVPAATEVLMPDDASAAEVVTEVTAGPGTLPAGLEVTGMPAARESGGVGRRWQVLTIRGDRVADIRGFDDRATAATRARVPA
jgi:hypothetical protein